MEEVREKLRKGIYKATDISKIKSFTSDVWKNFLRIYENEKPLSFVICKFLQMLARYRKEKEKILDHETGTGGNEYAGDETGQDGKKILDPRTGTGGNDEAADGTGRDGNKNHSRFSPPSAEAAAAER